MEVLIGEYASYLGSTLCPAPHVTPRLRTNCPPGDAPISPAKPRARPAKLQYNPPSSVPEHPLSFLPARRISLNVLSILLHSQHQYHSCDRLSTLGEKKKRKQKESPYRQNRCNYRPERRSGYPYPRTANAADVRRRRRTPAWNWGRCGVKKKKCRRSTAPGKPAIVFPSLRSAKDGSINLM